MPPQPEALPLAPTITPLPLNPALPFAQDAVALDIPTPTDVGLVKRQSIVTLSVTASSGPTQTAAATKSSFPVTVAVPALVGGMALALLGFGLWWWIMKKRRKEKQRRYERQQRRARKRANTNTSRPSISSSRAPSGQKSPSDEKQFIPPVPSLPKHAASPYSQANPREKDGNPATSPTNRYHQAGPPQALQQQSAQHVEYMRQPPIEYEQQRLPVNDAVALGAPIDQDYEEEPSQSQSRSKSSRPSRSTARVAAAEQAAAALHGDPMTRHQPKKPSPLALKAAEKNGGGQTAPGWGDGPFRQPLTEGDSNALETLAAPQDAYLAPAGGNQRQVSGEWGVALGSPNHDGNFEQMSGTARSRYSNDPYLSRDGNGYEEATQEVPRGKSGVYASDPYAAYHDEGENKRRNWV